MPSNTQNSQFNKLIDEYIKRRNNKKLSNKNEKFVARKKDIELLEEECKKFQITLTEITKKQGQEAAEKVMILLGAALTADIKLKDAVKLTTLINKITKSPGDNRLYEEMMETAQKYRNLKAKKHLKQQQKHEDALMNHLIIVMAIGTLAISLIMIFAPPVGIMSLIIALGGAITTVNMVGAAIERSAEKKQIQKYMKSLNFNQSREKFFSNPANINLSTDDITAPRNDRPL